MTNEEMKYNRLRKKTMDIANDLRDKIFNNWSVIENENDEWIQLCRLICNSYTLYDLYMYDDNYEKNEKSREAWLNRLQQGMENWKTHRPSEDMMDDLYSLIDAAKEADELYRGRDLEKEAFQNNVEKVKHEIENFRKLYQIVLEVEGGKIVAKSKNFTADLY